MVLLVFIIVSNMYGCDTTHNDPSELMADDSLYYDVVDCDTVSDTVMYPNPDLVNIELPKELRE